MNKLFSTIIAISTFIVISQSCKTEKINLAILIKDREVTLDYFEQIYPSSINIWYEKDSLFLTTSISSTRELVTFNMENGEVKEIIPINYFAEQDLFSFHYQNKDSIFLGFNAATHSKYWHDSTLFLINNKGGVIKVFSPQELPVASSFKQGISKDTSCYIAFHLGNIYYYNNNLNFLIPRLRYAPGDSLFESFKMPIGGYIRDGKTFYYPIYFKTPSEIIGKGYMPRNFNFIRWTFDNNGVPIFGFGHTANLFKFNPSTNKMDSFFVNSVLIDKFNIHLYSDRYASPQFDFNMPEYLKLYHNKHNDLYVRALRLPDSSLVSNPFNDKYFKQHEPPGVFIFFNKEFKILGECLVPFGFSLDHFFL